MKVSSRSQTLVETNVVDVFISYAHEDHSVATQLTSHLEAMGFSVWWDKRIHAGQDFEQSIEMNLRVAKCVLVLFSKHSISSTYVRGEADFAEKMGKLIPLALGEIIPPIRYSTLHYHRLQASTVTQTDMEGIERAVTSKLLGKDEPLASHIPRPRPRLPSGRKIAADALKYITDIISTTRSAWIKHIALSGSVCVAGVAIAIILPHYAEGGILVSASALLPFKDAIRLRARISTYHSLMSRLNFACTNRYYDHNRLQTLLEQIDTATVRAL